MKAFLLLERGKAALVDDAPLPALPEPYGAILSPVAVAPCTSDVNTVYGTGSKKPDRLILCSMRSYRALSTETLQDAAEQIFPAQEAK